jgi:hypothetical protein
MAIYYVFILHCCMYGPRWFHIPVSSLVRHIQKRCNCHGLEILTFKCKVVPVLNWLSTMPWRHTWEWRYSSTFLTSALVWSQRSASQLCWFTSKEAAFTKIYKHSEYIWHLMAFNMNYIVKDTLGIPLSPILSSYEVFIYYLPIQEELLGTV